MVGSMKLAHGHALALAAALVLVGATPAGAVVRVSVVANEGLRIEAVGADAVDRLLVQPDVSGGTEVVKVVELNSAVMEVGPGCGVTGGITANTVRCSKPSVPIVNALLGGGSDIFEIEVGVGECLCDGGPGNDTMKGSTGQDRLDGGFGNDNLNGGAGDDTLDGGSGADLVNGSTGADTLRGGDGPDLFPAPLGDGADVFEGGTGPGDTVDYSSRSAAVTVTIGAVGSDGTSFRDGPEGDDVRSSIENVKGGSGNDDISAFFVNVGVTLDGGPGNDLLRGTETRDDTLIGGPGIDRLRGFGGNDRLLARDGEDDQVLEAFSCGTGDADFLQVDLKDDDTRPITGTSCDTVDSGARDELPNVQNRSDSLRRRGGKATVLLHCPKATKNGCTGTLAAAKPTSRPRFGAATRYSIRPGRTSRVTVAVPSGGTRLVVRSLEKGRSGARASYWTRRVRG